jgi:transcriptional regulator with XRE-family HTH domain
LTAPPQEPAALGSLLGQRMKDRRRELGRKLAEVAEAAGVSSGYLSAIEHGASVPSLPVLARLSHALELSLAELLRSSASPKVARGHLLDTIGRTRLAVPGSQLQIMRLASRPGTSGRAPIALETTDVFVFVYRGRLGVTVDEGAFELEEGDALQCDRPSTIAWEALGPEPTISLWTAAARRGPAG